MVNMPRRWPADRDVTPSGDRDSQDTIRTLKPTATSPSEDGKLGKYEIRAVLGRGAAGTVFEAWDPVIERKVAIKTVHLPATNDSEAQEMFARFRREAQAAGRLSHPNIVGVFDYGEAEGYAYIVMEFVEGRSLESILDGEERPALPAAINVMQDLLSGLQYSHEHHVIHRDIKPSNIMLTPEGRAKIADFGIAKIENSAITQAGTVLGTPAYMSPEQFMGQTVDSRTDIYSAGVVLYELVTGERPFEGSAASIMHKALHTSPLKPSDISVTVPPRLDVVVANAMARRPEDRYASASEFSQALRCALSANTVRSAMPVEREPDATHLSLPPQFREVAPLHAAPASRWPSRRLLALAAFAALLISASAGLWFIQRGRERLASHVEVAEVTALPSQQPPTQVTQPNVPVPPAEVSPIPRQPPSPLSEQLGSSPGEERPSPQPEPVMSAPEQGQTVQQPTAPPAALPPTLPSVPNVGSSPPPEQLPLLSPPAPPLRNAPEPPPVALLPVPPAPPPRIQEAPKPKRPPLSEPPPVSGRTPPPRTMSPARPNSAMPSPPSDGQEYFLQAYEAYQAQNYAQARSLYQRCAETGNARCAYSLGNMNQQGLGGGADYSQARFWYEKAANHGYAMGLYAMGLLYVQGGPGLAKDCAIAHQWFEQAAARGIPAAQTMLGRSCY